MHVAAPGRWRHMHVSQWIVRYAVLASLRPVVEKQRLQA